MLREVWRRLTKEPSEVWSSNVPRLIAMQDRPEPHAQPLHQKVRITEENISSANRGYIWWVRRPALQVDGSWVDHRCGGEIFCELDLIIQQRSIRPSGGYSPTIDFLWDFFFFSYVVVVKSRADIKPGKIVLSSICTKVAKPTQVWENLETQRLFFLFRPCSLCVAREQFWSTWMGLFWGYGNFGFLTEWPYHTQDVQITSRQLCSSAVSALYFLRKESLRGSVAWTQNNRQEQRLISS